MNEEPQPAERARGIAVQVAIDGPAGAGKTTIGAALARHLDVPLLDTGMMYRAVTKAIHIRGVDPSKQAQVIDVASELHFSLHELGEAPCIVVNEKKVEESELHTFLIDRDVSIIAAYSAVRSILVRSQRAMADRQAIVMLGRDIGTVVLPQADVKLFVTASSQERAARRSLQQSHLDGSSTAFSISQTMAHRDDRDSHREASPLRAADDSVVINTTGQSVDQSVSAAMEVVEAVLRGKVEAGA